MNFFFEFEKKILQTQQLLLKNQQHIHLEKEEQFKKKEVSVNAKMQEINEDPTSKLNQLKKLKITVEENSKSFDNKLNKHKQNVFNHKIKIDEFEEKKQYFENLLKKFALKQKSVQDGEFKLSQLMEILLLENDKSNEVTHRCILSYA